MEIRREDLALLSRFFGGKAIQSLDVFYERRIFSKIKVRLTMENGAEQVLRIYITTNKIVIF
ncbi:MAG TPA: hypothetical protein VFE50_11335 [Cyclobacteriaceae bacterium]|nr:hypothetical protein [Cyclobacteriaceae bacterium]